MAGAVRGVVKLSEGIDRLEEQLRLVGGEAADAAALLSDLEQLELSRSRGVLERVIRDVGAGAVPLMEDLSGRASPQLAEALAELLGAINDPSAAAALRQLASTAPVPGVRKAARRSLHRLASLGIQPPPETEAPPRAAPRAEWSPFKTLASPIDGAGNRAMWLGLNRGGDTELVALVLSDRLGIVDFFATDMTRSSFDKEISGLLGDADQPWIEMPEDYCRHLIQEAHGRNAGSGTPLSPEFIAWRGAIGRPEGHYDQPLVYTVINAAEVRWDPRTLDRSGELPQLKMFQTWILAKDEIGVFVRDLLSARQSGIMLAGLDPETREAMVVDRAIHELFDVGRRALYKRRLEEMAYHLFKLGRLDPSKLSLAAALGLEPPDRPLRTHPFVRRMVERSLDVAVAMAEEERTRELGPGARLHLPY